jgi:ABC-type transport system involved in cytochrome bd biosynthesis fused ATPase/permease subunit
MGGSRNLFFGAVFGALVSTAIVIANGFLIAAVIVGIIYGHPNISTQIGLLAALWLFRALFTSQFERWALVQASGLKSQLRQSITDSQSGILATSSAHLTTLLVKGANSLDIYLARFLPQMFSASVTPFAVVVAMAFLDLTSALIALITIPLIPIFGVLIGKYTSDAVTAKWQSLGLLSRYFDDSLRGIFTLAIYGRHKTQGARIQEMGDRYTDETMKVLRISFLSALVLELAATISVAVIAVSIGLRLVGGSMDFFPALAVLVLAPEVYFPLRNAASLFHASADGGAALAELVELMKREPEKLRSGSVKVQGITTIRWSNWSSPYSPATLETRTLVTGDCLVIRGGSGLGKTTFLNSILGFNQSAEIEINGLAIAEIEKQSLFSQIGWIPQNPALISGSVRELFSQLPKKLTDIQIEKQLLEVGLSLRQLPDGLETQIGGTGEKSGHISGGQRRRLAVARALAISPSLIIADEPTADLDPDSAREILLLLERCAAAGAIVIAVLHAADQSIAGADEIVMAEE